jgi:ABC-type Mn2+/Zn2+ transport system permease subunit
MQPTSLLDTLSGPLTFELTQRALLGATLVSIACGVLGVLVLLRGQAFIGDALSHCVVPGVVVATMTHASQELWGAGAAILSAWGMATLVRRRVLESDPAIAVVFTGTFALGLAVISSTRSYMADLTDILFGAILAVSATDLALSGVAASVVVVAVVVLYWPLVLTSFDPVAAEGQGLPVGRLDLIFYGLLALAIVAGMIAVGTALVIGLLIVPAATARLFSRRVGVQMALSALVGCLASWIGLYVSYFFPIASGGAIILAAGGIFATALLATGGRGLAARRVRSHPAGNPIPTAGGS